MFCLGFFFLCFLIFFWSLFLVFFRDFFFQNKKTPSRLPLWSSTYGAQASPDQVLTSPSGVQLSIYTASAKCESRTNFPFYWGREGCLGLKNASDHRPFWKLENLLSPGGSLRKQKPWRSNCFYLCFIIKKSFYFIGVGKGLWGLKITCDQSPFWKLEHFYWPKKCSWERDRLNERERDCLRDRDRVSKVSFKFLYTHLV